jgi:hypothetical protein
VPEGTVKFQFRLLDRGIKGKITMSDGATPAPAGDTAVTHHDPQDAVTPSMERWQAVFNVIVAFIFFAVFVAAINTATGYNPAGRRLPIFLLTPMAFLAFGLVLTEFRRLRRVLAEHDAWALHGEGRGSRTTPAAVDEDADPNGRQDIYAVLWLGLFTALVVALGALLGTFVFSLIFLNRRGERLLMTLVYSVSVPVALHVIFGVLLSVRPYRGMLGWF